MTNENIISIYTLIANIIVFCCILAVAVKIKNVKKKNIRLNIKIDPVQEVNSSVDITHIVEGEGPYIDV